MRIEVGTEIDGRLIIAEALRAEADKLEHDAARGVPIGCVPDERGGIRLLLWLRLLPFPLLPRSLPLRPSFAFDHHRLLAFVRHSPLLGAGIAGAIGHGASLIPDGSLWSGLSPMLCVAVKVSSVASAVVTSNMGKVFRGRT